MIREEIYKVFIKQKAILWILVFTVIKIACICLGSNVDEIENQTAYDFYMDKLGGELCSEKETFIKNQYLKLNKVAETINDLEEKYENGTITRESYLEEMTRIAQIKQEQDVIKLFNKKYKYVAEDSSNRYIINENGWNELLTADNADYILILLIFLLTVPIFCNEYETKMDSILLSGKNGRLRLVTIKIIMLCVTAGILSLCYSLMEYIYYKAVCELDYGNAPIQSLSFFAESSYSFTLFHLWLLVTVIRAIGAIFLCLLIMAVSIWVKKSLLSIIMSALLVVIPICISAVSRVKYIIPLPAGLMYGIGYFFPNIYEYQFSEELDDIEKYISFAAFDSKELCMIGISYIVVMILLVFMIYKKYLGISLRVKIKKGMQMMLVTGVLVLGVSGCTKETDGRDKEFFEIAYSSDIQITDQYIFSIMGDSQIAGWDTETGESFYVLRDVFEQTDNEEFSVSIFATGKYLYYAKDYDDEFQIYQIDLSDFSEKWLYSMPHDDNVKYVLSHVSKDTYFIYDSVGQDYSFIDRNTNKIMSLYCCGSIILGDYGNTVYYENNSSQLVEYHMDTGEETVLSDIRLRSQYSVKDSYYYIYGNMCYYTNMLDHDYIYCYNLDTGENKMFLNVNGIYHFRANDQYFYYIDTNKDGKLYQVNLNTLQKKELNDNIENGMEMSVDGNSLYTYDSENNSWKIINAKK